MPADTEIETKKKSSGTIKALKLLLKIGITGLCFWYVSGKIDFSKALESLKDASWVLIFISVLVYGVSKVVAAYRLNIYFHNINLRLNKWHNLKLYWLGMFYNLFLPGSISGDAYKVIVLTKHRQAPFKKTTAAVLLDRFSGLLGLGIILCGYSLALLDNSLYNLILTGGCLLAMGAFYLVIKFLFPEFLPGFFSTLVLGIVVQAIQVGGIYFIMRALQIDTGLHQWIFIFLSASVISVLPLSLGGGLGTREVVFAEGAGYFSLDPAVGVTISLLFYLSSVAASAWGAWYIVNDPLKK